MYAIAGYLTEAQRRKALGVTYKPQSPNGVTWVPRTDDGYCPLGLCLQDEIRKVFKINIEIKAPGSFFIPPALGYKAATSKYMDIAQDAQQFIHDWDANKITNLAEALGIEDGAS